MLKIDLSILAPPCFVVSRRSLCLSVSLSLCAWTSCPCSFVVNYLVFIYRHYFDCLVKQLLDVLFRSKALFSDRNSENQNET